MINGGMIFHNIFPQDWIQDTQLLLNRDTNDVLKNRLYLVKINLDFANKLISKSKVVL